MRISARIQYVVGGEKLKAYASVCFDGCFLIDGIKIIDGDKGRFISMPSKKSKRGEYYDVCFPITREFRKTIENAVLDAYQKRLEDL